jgi:hypothetical protein
MGRHARQLCRTDAQEFPNKAAKLTSVVGGLRTGDLVRALVPASSIKAGVYVGRLAMRATVVQQSCAFHRNVGLGYHRAQRRRTVWRDSHFFRHFVGLRVIC